MRHKVAGRRLNRDMGHRKALRRNLMKQLFAHERIKTTDAKAKAIRSEAEKLITIAKRGNASETDMGKVNAIRQIAKKLGDNDAAVHVVNEIAPRYAERPGGYTRMLKLGQRAGDAAQVVLLELVEE